jgi:hypothetical protein
MALNSAVPTSRSLDHDFSFSILVSFWSGIVVEGLAKEVGRSGEAFAGCGFGRSGKLAEAL